MLGLELVGEVEVAEEAPPTPGNMPAKLRASHHQVARLDAKGLAPAEISRQTGYAPVSISHLRRCPSYQELVTFYRRDADHVAEMVEAKFQLIAEDVAQVIHERILEGEEELSVQEALDVFKAFADRSGFAPVQRTVNRNVNLNIGARLDEARRRRTIDAE